MDFPLLSFEKPDIETFVNLQLAYSAIEKGGNAPCVLNAANEIVVDAFLKDKIGFLEMSELIELAIQKSNLIAKPNYQDYIETDLETRKFVTKIINKK